MIKLPSALVATVLLCVVHTTSPVKAEDPGGSSGVKQHTKDLRNTNPVQLSSGACSFQVVITVTDATCSEHDGAALATVTGGVPPYSYQWTSGDTTANADSLTAGIYVLTVSDTGCSAAIIAAVSDLTAPDLTIDAIGDETCSGSGDGSASLSTSGGVSPYTYGWSSGDTTEDLSGLKAGSYEVVVEDAGGCIASLTLSVGAPAPIALNTVTIDANCGNSDGSVTISVNGGTAPYSYIWTTGASSSALNGIVAGAYGVTVTDSAGCSASTDAAVSEAGSAVIVIDSTQGISCGTSGGAIFITASSAATPLTYLWSNGAGTEDLSNVPAGTYSVAITDTNGCVALAIAGIKPNRAAKPLICLVTVDSVTGRNVCVFEKDSAFNSGVDYYNFYKESIQGGAFQWIGSKGSSLLSAWADAGSNTGQRSWRYKVAAVDTCGIESWWSDVHKTMHLSIKKGLANSFDLIWDHYIGYSFPSYVIHRYHPATGWIAIDTIQSNRYTYTDFNVPQGPVTYTVEAVHPAGCLATKTKNFNSSKSNTSTAMAPGPMTVTMGTTDATTGNCDGVATVTPGGGIAPFTFLWDDPAAQTSATANGLCSGTYTVTVIDANGNAAQGSALISEPTGLASMPAHYAVRLSPNPFNRSTTIAFTRSGQENISLTICDVTGKMVRRYESIATDRVVVERNGLASGIYYFELKGGRGSVFGKLVIQ